jgi:hypothetical protein
MPWEALSWSALGALFALVARRWFVERAAWRMYERCSGETREYLALRTADWDSAHRYMARQDAALDCVCKVYDAPLWQWTPDAAREALKGGV